MSKCNQPNCGCNSPGQQYICYTTEPLAPCIGVNLTVNNTEDPNGYSDVNMVLEETNQISAYKEHLEFVNSPEPLSGLKRHVVLRLTAKFLNSIANLFKGRNVGTGAQIYKGSTTVGVDTFQDFRTIKSSSSVDIVQQGDEIVASVNEQWFDDNVPDPIIPNYPVINGASDGDGTSLFSKLLNKILYIKSIEGGDGIRIQDTGDKVIISAPTGSSSNSDWFLDRNYQRPANWANDPGREVINYTSQISGLDLPLGTYKMPKGSLSDPFITYEEFLLKYIGNPTDSTTGENYSRVNPEQGSVRLQILNGVDTKSDIEVNNASLILKNKSYLYYTGSREYAISFRNLWNAMPRVGGILKRSLYMAIGGEGGITRSSFGTEPKFGLVDIKMNHTETNSDIKAAFEWLPEGNGFYVIESENIYTRNPDGTVATGLYQQLYREDETTKLMNGNGLVFGANQPPVTPLVLVDGHTFQYWSMLGTGTKLFFICKSQKAIHLINGGSVTWSIDRVYYQVDNAFIGYEKKMWKNGSTYFPAGLTQDEKDMVDAVTNSNNPNGLFFKPYSEYSIFSAEDGGMFRIESLGTAPNGFLNHAADSIVRLKNGSSFDHQTSWSDTGGGGCVNFVEVIGSGNWIAINNGIFTSLIHNLIKGDGTNSTSFNLVNTIIKAVKQKIKKNIISVDIQTEGTVSSLQYKPIITMNEFDTNQQALDNGLIPGMLYKDNDTGTSDTDNNTVKQVVTAVQA